VNTIGNILDLVASGNESGYDISAQRFFAGMNRPAPRRPALCAARQNIPFAAFEFLLDQAGAQYQGLVERWHGHPLRIIDGSKINLPRSSELVEKFEVPNTKAGPAHYPQAWMVTLIGGYCCQPLAVTVGGHKASERDLMRDLFPKLNSGDLVLVDRGLGGGSVYYDFERNDLFYIHRAKTSGDRVPLYIQLFLAKKKVSEVTSIEVTNEHGAKKAILVRLVRGPKDSEGKRIVFVTNLLDEKIYTVQAIRALYKERWSIETMYGRVKNILKLEKFHARSFNGIMQEIYANLLIISLTAAIEYESSKAQRLDRQKVVPNFKAAMQVVYRHLHAVVGTAPLTLRVTKETAAKMIEDAGRILWKKQPGRSYPRVSRQPIKSWNLCKQRKLKEFNKMGN
jgi:hypothetical protein